jgi:hypothetical protein
MVNADVINKFIKMDFCLIPLNDNSKIAKIKWSGRAKKELNDATLKHKGTNFAIKTGKMSNIYVLDIDDYKKECEIKEKLNQIETFKVKTPRGGLHLYFKYNSKITQTVNETLAIDIRSDGGYVVAPTSTVDGNEYEIISDNEVCETPDWLLDYIFSKIGKKRVSPKSNKQKNLKSVVILFAELSEKVLGLNEERASNYDDWLKVGFIIQETSIANDYYEEGRELFHEFSKKCIEKYNPEKVDEFYNTVREIDNKAKFPTLCLMYNEDNNFTKSYEKDIDGEEFFGEKDCAIKLYEKHAKNIVYTSNGIYCKHERSGIWDINHEKMIKIYIQNSGLYCVNPMNEQKSFLRNQTSRWKTIITQVETYIYSNIQPNEAFITNLDNYTGYIPFLNCCYDLVNQKWIEKLPAEYYCSKVINFTIDTECIATEDELITVNSWFDSILEDYKEEFLTYCIRMLGGHSQDKKWLASIGLRNSGKGVIEKIFKHLFGNFVGQIDAKNLEFKKSMESTERSRGFLEPFTNCRLVFSSEARPKAIIDGTIIKSISSGGDSIEYRQSYGTLKKGDYKAGFVFQANSLPDFDNPDAFENMLYLPMPSKFVEEEDLNTDYGGYNVKLADPLIKDKIREDKFKTAFYSVVFSYYGKKNMAYPQLTNMSKNLRENEGGDVNEFNTFKLILFEYCVLSNDKIDYIKATELHAIIRNSTLSMNCDRIKKYMMSLGCKADTNNGRCYKGIKYKTNSVENHGI